MKLEKIKEKKTLILGFGREGKNTFLFLRSLFPNKTLYVADKKEEFFDEEKSLIKSENVKSFLGKNYLNNLNDYDLIVKSPGIPFKIIPKSVLGKIISQTEIFFDNFKGTIIGVTGTKGKGTTSSLIYSILKNAGKEVVLAGNIGKPVLDFIFKKGIFVYELSSHQLYNLKSSPNVAVLLNIFPDHMDYYESFKEYVSCKENITKNQTENDYLIYNEEDIEVKNIASRSKAKKISVKGKYLDLNINAAKEVARLFNIKEDIILDSIKNTKSMEHRMEFVGNFKGIDFYNDSASTIPESTICALDYFKGRVDTLILGGSEKYLDIKKLVERIEKGNVKNLIFFPLTGKKIWEEIKNKDNFKSFFAKNMKEAVEFCFENTEKGKVCLLSPAFASFSVFKDYRERGEKFKEEIFKKI